MKHRNLQGSDLRISEIGFGLWTVSTGWWGNYTDEEAVRLMRLAADQGINLFDAADTYGNGRSEELIAKAVPGAERDRVVIATKVGYDFMNHGDGRRGQREIPQDFSPSAIRNAVEAALKRLGTDHIDILQLHNIREAQVLDDALWEVMEDLRAEGKYLHGGIALGPAIGWIGEGASAIALRKPDVVQPNDHRNHRPRSWLLNGVKKIDQLRFLERPDRTLGQAAMLWLLKDPQTLSILPNIYNEEQIREFAATPECPPLTDGEMLEIQELVSSHFGMEPEEHKFKGEMELPAELAALLS